MSINDWKAALQSLNIDDDPSEMVEESESAANGCIENAEPCRRETATLQVIMERKGRGGKTATIIAGFTIDDDQVADIAARLKSKLGTGGSSRGGEILIQGDRRADIVKMLKEMGFKVNRSN